MWLHCAACGILVSWPVVKLVPLALKVWSLNHWTTREVFCWFFFFHFSIRGSRSFPYNKSGTYGWGPHHGKARAQMSVSRSSQSPSHTHTWPGAHPGFTLRPQHARVTTGGLPDPCPTSSHSHEHQQRTGAEMVKWIQTPLVSGALRGFKLSFSFMLSL